MLKSIKIKNLNKTAIEKFLKKNKKLVSLALAVAFITPLSGCNDKDKNKDEEPTATTSIVSTPFTYEVEPSEPQTPDKAQTPDEAKKESDSKTSKNESKKDNKSVFLADKLKGNIKDISSNSKKDDIVLPDSKTKDKDVVAVDESGNVIPYDVDGKNEYVTDEVKYDKDVYEAPNGKVYTNEKEYEKSIKANENENIKVAGKYTAPDGSTWESKEDYDNFQMGEVVTNEVNTEVISNQDGNVVTNVEESYEYNGNLNSDETIVWEETDSPIYSVDGENWESKDAYDYYMSDEYELDVYVAEDGTYWDTKESYIDFISSSTELAEDYEEETKVEEQEEKQEETKVEEEIKVEEQEEQQEETKVEEQEVKEEEQEETKFEEQEDNQEFNYYMDDNGMWWASYDDYLEVMGQNENVKQR